MPNQELLNYIKQEIDAGYTEEELRKVVLESGWEPKDVDEALHLVKEVPTSSQVISEFTYGYPRINIVLKRSFEIFRKTWKRILGIYFLPIILAVLAVVMNIIVGFSTVNSNLSLSLGKAGPSITPSLINLLAGLPVVLLAINFIFAFVGVLLLLAACGAAQYVIVRHEESVGILMAYKKGFKYLLSNLWISTLVIVKVIIGLIVGIIPGIMNSLYYLQAPWVLFDQDIKGLAALEKSKEYVKGMWFDTYIYFSALSIFFTPLYYILLIPSGFMTLFFANVKNITVIGTVLGIGGVLFIIVSVLVSMFFEIYSYVLYYYAKQVQKPQMKSREKYVWFVGLAVMIITLGLVITLSILAIVLGPKLPKTIQGLDSSKNIPSFTGTSELNQLFHPSNTEAPAADIPLSLNPFEQGRLAADDAEIIGDVRTIEADLKILKTEKGAYPTCPDTNVKYCTVADLKLPYLLKDIAEVKFPYYSDGNDYKIEFELNQSHSGGYSAGKNCATSTNIIAGGCF